MAIEYLGGKCIRCGHQGWAATFEFHHRDPSKKEFQISSGNTNSWNSIKKEVEKCDLLCSNCHREVHYSSQELEKEIRQHLNDPPLGPKVCIDCGGSTSKRGIRCSSCAKKRNEKIEWPSTKHLLEELKNSNFVQLGRKLGVSDNAIRKRIRLHPLLDSSVDRARNC